MIFISLVHVTTGCFNRMSKEYVFSEYATGCIKKYFYIKNPINY